jgi:hypothetical protein
MQGNLLKLLAAVLVGGSITVAVQPRALVPVAVALAVATAIVVWNLSCGGTATLRRSPKGYLSFKLSGPRARRRAARRRTTAEPDQSLGGPSAGGVSVGGTPGPYTPRPLPSSAGKVVSGIAIVLLAFGGGVYTWVASDHPAEQVPHALQTQPAASASRPGPAAVVKSYFTAINRRDWKRVWQLWHGRTTQDHHPPYGRIAAGFRETKRDVVTSIKTDGDHVSVRVLAYETTGAVQTYAFGYLVHRGHITQGWSRLLSTRLR